MGLDDAALAEIDRWVEPRHRQKVIDSLVLAANAFGEERYADAARVLRPLAQQNPDAAPIRELYGLTLYRQGRWRAALGELEAADQRRGSVDQFPVRADCHRALGQHRAVEDLWDGLRQEGVAVEVLTEGRIVTAGSRADRGDLREAIALLEAGVKPVRRAQEHNLRLWYALGALYERAGDLPRARTLFRDVVVSDPSFADAAERLSSLS